MSWLGVKARTPAWRGGCHFLKAVYLPILMFSMKLFCVLPPGGIETVAAYTGEKSDECSCLLLAGIKILDCDGLGASLAAPIVWPAQGLAEMAALPACTRGTGA